MDTSEDICPICKVVFINSIKKFICPLVRSENICLSCCLDISATCRSPNFSKHPHLGKITHAIQNTSHDLKSARMMCLEHQLSLLNENPDINIIEGLAAQREEVKTLLNILCFE